MSNTINSGLMPKIIGRAVDALRYGNDMLASVNGDFSAETGQKGQSIYFGESASLEAASTSAANVAPAPSAISMGAKVVTMSSEYKTSFALSGKEYQDNSLSSTFERQIDQAVFGVLNKVNEDLLALYYKIPYAVGNCGAGFLASNIDGFAAADKMLTDHKCPLIGRKAILSTKDYKDALSDSTLQAANTYGGTEVVRRGVIQDVLGFEVRRDPQTPTHVRGTITGGTWGATAAGETSLAVTCATAEGIALKKGDILEMDAAQYSVQADVTVAAGAAGVVTIDRGLLTALDGDEAVSFATTDCTFDGNTLVNIAGDMSGFAIASRLPATEIFGYKVQGEHFPIQDPVTGYSLLLSIYPQYRQVAFEVSSIWGVNVLQSEKLVRLLSYNS